MIAGGRGWTEIWNLLRLLYRAARDVRKNALAAVALWGGAAAALGLREAALSVGTSEPWATLVPALLAAWVVWSFVSAALTRLAALEIGAGEEPRLGEAIGFALRRFFVHLFTPPSMLVATAIFLAPAALLGLLARTGSAGLAIAAVLSPLALVSAVAAAATATGFVLGSSLVCAGLVSEASSGFDAVSRTASYLAGAPLVFVLLRLGLLAYGLAAFAVRCGLAALAALGASRLFALVAGLDFPAPFWPHFEAGRLVVPAPGGSLLYSIGLAIFYSYALAFALSFACTARVVAYLALRRHVDGTHPCVIARTDAPRSIAAPAKTP